MWFDEEAKALRPRIIIALGATAASVVVGPSVRVTRDRGKPLPSPLATVVAVTVHPSSILRAPDSASRASARRAFVNDLRQLTRRSLHGPGR